jgi:hypothetical protein
MWHHITADTSTYTTTDAASPRLWIHLCELFQF